MLESMWEILWLQMIGGEETTNKIQRLFVYIYLYIWIYIFLFQHFIWYWKRSCLEKLYVCKLSMIVSFIKMVGLRLFNYLLVSSAKYRGKNWCRVQSLSLMSNLISFAPCWLTKLYDDGSIFECQFFTFLPIILYFATGNIFCIEMNVFELLLFCVQTGVWNSQFF